MMDNKKIVWLASYPKSGNTWFRIFLSNLLSDDEKPVHINQLYSTPIASGRSIFDENAGVSSSDLSGEEIEMFRPAVYREIASNSTDLFFQKVHDAWKRTPLGEALFPEDITKAVIYFIRNPLDVAVSYSYHSSASLEKTVKQMNDPSNAFCAKPGRLYNQLRQYLSSWSGHVKSWTEESGLPVLVLRYEDMLEDTYKEFSRAINFLNLKFPEEKIRLAIHHTTFENLRKMEQEEGFKEKPIKMDSFFREGRANSWRNHLDNKLVQEIIDVHGEVMRKYGYLE